MPDIKPRDYTTSELTHAANVCNDAAKLLEPASNELMRIVNDLEPERPEEALLYARTARHLGDAVFHLKASEATIRQITTNVGRTYTSVTSWYRGLALAVGRWSWCSPRCGSRPRNIDRRPITNGRASIDSA